MVGAGDTDGLGPSLVGGLVGLVLGNLRWLPMPILKRAIGVVLLVSGVALVALAWTIGGR